jgi:hypothetical protein
MKANDFVSRLYNIATTKKTVYAWGMFGSPITSSIVTGKAKQYPSWYTDAKINGIFAPLYGRTPTAWGFDCIGLIKGVLWGWDNGGAKYGSNGVPDVTADSMIYKCLDVSTDFSSIAIGEFLWMKGHCGIYIGDGLAVESAPKWENGVQITACNQSIKGFNTRYWTSHGKLPYVTYGDRKEVSGTVSIEMTVLRKGSKGKQVETLQRLLNAFGSNLGVDGDFGSKTDGALRSYQKANKLEVDGICGGKSWNSLLK